MGGEFGRLLARGTEGGIIKGAKILPHSPGRGLGVELVGRPVADRRCVLFVGFGRFSCDRLSALLNLYALEEGDTQPVHLHIDWAKFENSVITEFGTVEVDLDEGATPPVPRQASALTDHSVMIRISQLRDQ